MKNNNEKFENFIRDFKTIKMTNIEKDTIQENLESFAHTYTQRPSPYYSYISIFKKSMVFALIALLVISASKPASAKALPGELLYGVKIIHEQIKSASIQQPEEKVIFEIERTETRIREAVELAEAKELSNPLQEKLAKDIKKQVKNINEKIQEIKIDNPEKALSLNSDLKTTLKVNSEALKKVTQKKISDKAEETLAIEDEELAEETSDTVDTPKDLVEEELLEETEEVLTIEGEELAEETSDTVDTPKDLVEEELLEETEEVLTIEGEELAEETSDTVDTLKAEISSLENILIAEEKLKNLLIELSKERDPENKKLVQELIKNKQFGQAYVYIKNEIEILAELKLQRELELELGISMEETKNSE